MPTALSSADLLTLLGSEMPFDNAERSYKPMFSDVGLGFDSTQGGLSQVFLHYNRRVIHLPSPHAPLGPVVGTPRQTLLGVAQDLAGGGSCAVSCCGRNTYVIELTGRDSLTWLPTAPALSLVDGPSSQSDAGDTFVWRGLVTLLDPRDPDRAAPYVCGLRVLTGQARVSPEGHVVITNVGGMVRLAVAWGVLDLVQPLATLAEAAPSVAAARDRVFAWWRDSVGPLTLTTADDKEAKVLAMAVATLLVNATRAPGLLAGRVAVFPNRGAYPTHYLWDSCFHTLALADMAPGLAEDSLLLLTESMRVDGKMAHFLCSTWMRPHESQPPLVGWAGLRLVRQRHAQDPAAARRLALTLLPALRRNARWWLDYRMTAHGLICCPEPMETGWDDTPRLDQGPVLALDMNSYLILTLDAAAELADYVGQPGANTDRAQADRLRKRLYELAWDQELELFTDVLVKDLSRIKTLTPASFLPLLAGVGDPDPGRKKDQGQRCVSRYLLDPRRMFGTYPFPSIAYDHPDYIATPKASPHHQGPSGSGAACWRGPLWLPMAWFMLETLNTYGFPQEAQVARQRLWQMIVADGELCEYFDSQTGEGVGAKQQGWTAAIAIALNRSSAPAVALPA